MKPARDTSEQVILNERGIRVTNTRFIVERRAYRQTYAMSGITSVKKTVQRPSRLGPILIVLAGLLLLATGRAPIAGALPVIFGVVWFCFIWPKHTVSLTSASGEKNAYESTDGGFVEQVVGAINDAIVQRG